MHGSGIVPKAVYDTNSNKLVDLELPLNQETGMPISYSFMTRSLQEIAKNTLQPKSILVYVVMAQQVLFHASRFILQIFGTGNNLGSFQFEINSETLIWPFGHNNKTYK